MKKKQKTFAERAKEIQSKYSRAEWDKLERKDMLKELASLRDEQESVRASMGIGNEQGQQFDGYNGSQYLKTYNTTSGNNIMKDNTFDAQFSDIASGDIKTDNSLSGKQAPIDVDTNKWKTFIDSRFLNNSERNLATGSPTQPDQYKSMSDSFLPFAISAGASAIGDIAGLINQKKNMPKSVNLPRAAANLVNLEPQRQALGRSYNTASNVMLKNSRDAGSPANAYANQIAGLSGLTDSYGTQMGQSYMNQENTNAQIRNEASVQNAKIGSEEAMFNAQLQGQNAQMKGQYIDSLSNTIPNALRDYRQQINQTNMLNIMGKDYGLYSRYNPEMANMSFIEKLKMGILGPQYTVKSRNNPNIIS